MNRPSEKENRQMTRTAAAAAAAAVAVLALTGCAQADPCRGIPAAERPIVDFVRAHPEVEVETGGEHEAECVLGVDGRWAEEQDTEG